ncbi:MAG: hypothetical protein ACM3X6_00730 [Patescibacteria group bacterium]
MGHGEKETGAAEECAVYEPLMAAAVLTHGEEETEDAGCDSCLHFENGRCAIYRRERPL